MFLQDRIRGKVSSVSNPILSVMLASAKRERLEKVDVYQWKADTKGQKSLCIS